VFKVDATNVETYLAFDPVRRTDLEQIDALMAVSAPRLTRYFHAGTPPGEPGMRFKMIGYGQFHYAAANGKPVEWPVIGVALQKNYISLYVAPHQNGRPITDSYAGRLGELRSGDGNFSFRTFSDLSVVETAALFSEVQYRFENDPTCLAYLRRIDGGERQRPDL
jgi:hypothetical protein